MFLVNHLFVSVWTDEFFFYSLVYNPVLCYLLFILLFPLFQLQPLEALSVGSSPFDKAPSLWGFFFFFGTLLISGTISCSRLILCIPCSSPRGSHSSRSSVLFSGE